MAKVMSLAAQSPVVIFSKSNCCICYTIKTLIYGFGANPAIYELDELPNGQELEREILALGRRPSVPAVFIGREFVGGSNEIMSLHLQGDLVKKLKKAKAIFM
ncbi:monothiol glutaredoxin-S2-like [Actinidia eriantha]|uniref:monothiol glutaredoxin-S2-like n=1 Tax=Actinidia eriantha TaxID=165200 RepID=UPI00258E4EB2|nr:monothiol glutaredoxin-S2-like [Actinidia eriantha]